MTAVHAEVALSNLTGTTVLTPVMTVSALRAIVDQYGPDWATTYPYSDNPDGLAGKILQYHGADVPVMRVYGAFLDFMDCNIIPDSQFWFTGFTRDMLIEVDELDQAGFTFGEVLDRLESAFADRMHDGWDAA